MGRSKDNLRYFTSGLSVAFTSEMKSLRPEDLSVKSFVPADGRARNKGRKDRID
jgi:hypothetical protein